MNSGPKCMCLQIAEHRTGRVSGRIYSLLTRDIELARFLWRG